MEEIYKENAKIVYHFIYSLCHDSVLAEELTQETFMRAFQSIERFDGAVNFPHGFVKLQNIYIISILQNIKKKFPGKRQEIQFSMKLLRSVRWWHALNCWMY